MAWVDLTRPIRAGQPVYPGDPPVRIRAHASIGETGFAVSQLELGTHTGTHLDAPAHVRPDGAGVDDLPLDVLIGPARVVDVSHREAGAAIVPADLEPALASGPAPRLLLRSDWDLRYGEPGYYDRFPGLAAAALERIVAAGVRLLGLETPSVSPADDEDAHHRLLDSGIIIVEGLTGLRRLPKDIWLVVLPLPLAGLDGSPCRAAAYPGAHPS